MRRFSPGHCCCTTPVCSDCCGGTWPTEFDVEFTLTNDTCTNCAAFDGVYTLTKLSGVCTWRYDTGYTLTEDCNGNARKVLRRQVNLAITCNSDTTYSVLMTVKIWREQECYVGSCPPIGQRSTEWVDTHTWWKQDVPFPSWTCSGASSYEVPWYSRATSRNQSVTIFCTTCTNGIINTDFLCQSNSASAYITAVP